MFGVRQRSEAGLDLIPTLFVIDGCADDPSDEVRAFPLAGSPIDLGDEIVIEENVKSHDRNISHDIAHA